MGGLRVRMYGSAAAPVVFVLHGGPGAPGEVAPVAHALAARFQAIEPFQRPSGADPLTVERHIADLDETVKEHSGGRRFALVGYSWGAMLALAYAARHPHPAAPIVLIGCGTFDRRARARLISAVEARISPAMKEQLDHLRDSAADPDESLKAQARLLTPVYSFDPDTAAIEQGVSCDARAHHQTWSDMIHLQDQGVYPAGFARIHAPVLMLHGAFDPHPGALIRDSLAPFLPQIEYREWECCGHTPWIEKAAREEFFAVLIDWLERRLEADCAGTPASPMV